MANTIGLQGMANNAWPLYVIGWVGGGEVPHALSGFFTNEGTAQSAINTYVSSKEKRNKG